MLKLNAIIVKKGGTLTHEVVLCTLTRDGWVIEKSFDIYISKDLAENAARKWSSLYQAPYLGIKDGWSIFPYDDEEYRLALIEIAEPPAE